MNDFIDSFRKEALEMLENLERHMLKIQKDKGDIKIIHEIFRIMHSLKGASGMFGFNDVSEVAHELETTYDQIREGLRFTDDELIGLSFRSVDILRSIVREDIHGSREYDNLLTDIKAYSIENQNYIVSEEVTEAPETTATYLILYAPDKNIFNRGLNPLSVFNELENLGEYQSFIHQESIPLEQQIELKTCFSWWEIYLSASQPREEIDYVFMFNLEKEYKIIPVRSAEEIEALMPVLQEKYSDEPLDEEKVRNILTGYLARRIISTTTSAGSSEKISPVGESSARTTLGKTTISVSYEKLDEMMNLVSELVTANAELQLNAEIINNEHLHLVVEKIEKLSRRFKDNVLELRLIPISVLEVMIQRLVYDLSISLKKEIKLITEGMDTELDKTIINALESPLMHIIRNSIDHGIEPAEERIRKNKTREGLIKFISFYSGSNVFIQIHDDGRGIDFEKVRNAAIKKGLITEGQEVTDKDLLEFTMVPGFTTSENVSMVSGRGVGLDVVKNEIINLHGQIEINTEKDLGTIITIKLPLTLSIIDCLLLSVGNGHYLIPLSDIEYCYQERSDVILNESRDKIDFKNELVPLVNLHQFFGLEGGDQEYTKIIVLCKDKERIALTADKIIGNHQAVLKPLGIVFKNQEYLSGASILGDGNLALILDSTKIIAQIKSEKHLVIT